MIRQNNASDRSVPELLQDIGSNLEDIARSEFLLAKVEIKEEAARTARASATLSVGIVLSLYALGFLLLAAVYGLATQVAVWLAALIVGAVVGVIAFATIAVGKSKLQKALSESERSVKNLMNKEKSGWATTQNKLKDTLRNDVTTSARTSAS
jgi:uncharacterized membrane protein YqjE